MSTRTLSLLAVAALATLVGCGPSYDPELQNRTATYAGTIVNPTSVRIAAGTAVGVLVTDAGDEIDEDVSIGVVSRDPSKVGADRTLEKQVFILSGVSPGDASIDVSMDGEIFGSIPVTVFAQP